jgi:hypothetical protein
VQWVGVAVPRAALQEITTNVLADRLHDAIQEAECIDELRAAATTGMALAVIEELVCSKPAPEPWEVGEALAECFLEVWYEIIWPWNSGRDRRTPKASLPGADLIGFTVDDQGPVFVFGEVKTSDDAHAPPQVLYGRSGMIQQLERLATRKDIQFSLIKWLRPRCRNTEYWPLYEGAAQRYINSNGLDIRLVGCLMRDTQPDERDLQSRARALAALISTPCLAGLHAWYIPVPIKEWKRFTGEGGSNG